RVVQVDRRDRIAGALDLADQTVDLLAMHQQSARARRIGMHVRRSGRERGDMRADQHQPAVLDDDVRLLEMRASATNRLHLPAFERNPGLEAFLDKIVVKRLAVFDNAHWSHTHFCGRRRCARASRRSTARAFYAGRACTRGLRARRRCDNALMRCVTKSVLVPYSAAQMFELVDHVELYPQFLPWCGGTRVLAHDANRKTARIDIDYHGVRAHFTTDNVNDPPRSIVVTLKDGPFRHLHGEWRFIALTEHGCKV